MKNFFIPILIVLSLFFPSCENADKDQVVHELIFKTIPAWQKLTDFRMEMNNAAVRNMKWVNIPGASEEKTKQGAFVNDTYQKLKSDLKQAFMGQPQQDKVEIDSLLVSCDKQILVYKDIMDDLSSVVAYNDPGIFLYDQSMVLDNDGVCVVLSKVIDREMDGLLKRYELKMQEAKDNISKMERK